MSASESLFSASDLDQAVSALRKDLLADGGPQISTMRNHNFAILPYHPGGEYTLRRRIKRLIDDDLGPGGFAVLSIALQKLLFKRLRRLGDDNLRSLIDREKRLHARSPERALEHVKAKLIREIEGPGGLAADVAAEIERFCAEHPDRTDRAVVFVGRIGALYPFFRVSALLKHIASRTRNIPVVLLYPGIRRDTATNALSFMGVLEADRDYRPRVYP